ncbi:hypothetical protein SAMN05443377_1502 [Propionibacterium cyclohexanicum]|uniref:DUF4352 domain-containing protein n=1 Tax=Propionibacterium cyclohexanicum TaxID=64702 RepID=A0A1H9U9T3_9ACTN|nr:hypothetical protein SAMN05443377_1502 [Propionibacterium cyclohexanicum]
MLKRPSFRVILVISIVIVVGMAAAWRMATVNSRWPQINNHAVQPGEPLEIHGMTLTVTGAQLLTGDALPKNAKNLGYSTDDMKMILVDLVLRNDTTQDLDAGAIQTIFAFNLQSGQWYNGVSVKDVSSLNKDGMKNGIPVGAERHLVLPFNLLASQFTAESWPWVGQRDFSLVMVWYPDRYQLHLPRVEK